jgi:long-chain fatty acid transport protein
MNRSLCKLSAGQLAAALLVSIFGAQDVMAAGFQNMSQSATANAMGSMGTANPDEPNASFYNPANMAFQESFNIYIGNTNLLPTSTYQAPGGSDTVSTQSRYFPPPNLHVAMPISDTGFAVGVGVTLPYGLGITWDDNWAGQYSIISQDLQTLNINPNVAYKIPGLDLSVAAGAQIYRSSVLLKRNIGLSSDGSEKVRAELGGAGGGYGFTASVMYKPTKNFNIGLNYRSGVKLSMDGRAHFTGEEGTPFEGAFADQDISTELNIPHTVALGLGFTHEKLFVGFDAVYTTWSDYERVNLKFSRPCPDGSATCEPGETNPPTSVILGNWTDTFSFRLGAQYAVTDDLKARVGLVYDMSPVPEETLSPSLPDNDRIAVSAGVGYTIADLIRADLGYQFVSALEREVKNNPNLPGTYKTTAHVLGINIGYGY